MSGHPTHAQTFPVSWAELHRDARALAWRLKDSRPAGGWRGVVAVARGGLVPAAVVARELDLRVIETCCVVAYDAADRPSDKVRLVKPPIAAEDGAGWLVIDDLVDTGRTAEAVRATLPRAHFGTVYAKPAGRALVDSFVTLVAQETWILFPWDMDLRFVPPIAAVEP